MPMSNFEERVQKRLASSLKLRHYLMTLTALILLPLILFPLVDPDTRLSLLMIWILILCVGTIPAFVSLKRRKSVVFWVRRFHRGEDSRMEQQFLEGAVNPWGKLVTLADSSIHSASATRSAIWIVAIMGGIALLAAALLHNPFILYGFLGYAGVTVWAWIRKGKVGLKDDDWAKRLATVNQTRSVLAAGLSGVVLNCPRDTDRWREVIQILAPVVDAAVTSVPEYTPQVEWELEILKAALGPGKIIVLVMGGVPPAVAMEGLQVIEVPKSVSWWHDYRVSYFGAKWKSAMETVLRAIEGSRPESAAQIAALTGNPAPDVTR
jgi:hypothetical protein